MLTPIQLLSDYCLSHPYWCAWALLMAGFILGWIVGAFCMHARMSDIKEAATKRAYNKAFEDGHREGLKTMAQQAKDRSNRRAVEQILARR